MEESKKTVATPTDASVQADNGAVASAQRSKRHTSREAASSAAIQADAASQSVASPKPAAVPKAETSSVIAPKAQPSKAGNAPKFKPVAGPARFRMRHIILTLSFLLLVVGPASTTGIYLYTIAKDQYASSVGFSVRKEGTGSAIELLGGFTELSSASSSDTDILYEFIRSQQMVRVVNEQINLQEVYSRPSDPVFSIGNDARIEALHVYWQRMVKVYYDNVSGLIEVRVLAFAPEDAFEISSLLFAESSRMINKLSDVAKEDSTRFAEEELQQSVNRLRLARQTLTALQNRTQIVDPMVDLQGQMGLITSLQSQLTESMMERQMLLDTSSIDDPRVLITARRIDAIEGLITAERAKFSTSSSRDGQAYSAILAEFQALQFDLEFAEQSYIAALAAHNASLSDAQRQSRYLATYIEPTTPETPQFPQKFFLLTIISGFLFLVWSVLAMSYYSLRDRQ